MDADIYTRRLPAEIVADGRTLETRVVPYNVETTVADPPEFRPYRELFAAGAFKRQLAAAFRVGLNFEHHQGIGDFIGRATALEEQDDGLYGSFRLTRGPDGDKALELVHDGFLTGLSVEFRDVASRVVNGVVHRIHASIDNVALCRHPAYEGAEVLAVRNQPVVREPEPVMDPALVARLEALGVLLPA